MSKKTYFFAGGGTGGHIYPALAVAQRLKNLEAHSGIHFFSSQREIDSIILGKSGFEYTTLPVIPPQARDIVSLRFLREFYKSLRIAIKKIKSADNATIIGSGGFVSGPVVLAAKMCGRPIGFINVDIIPGKANKLMASLAKEIYVQFDQTKKHFNSDNVMATGCPLRIEFDNTDRESVIKEFDLDANKKTLLITGASSGAKNINDAIANLIDNLSGYADSWQIIHLTGRGKDEKLRNLYRDSKIKAVAIDYYDKMQNLLSLANIVIGRSGAVSVGEYINTQTPAICLPYPYHKDNHQYLNAEVMTRAGAAIIVEDNFPKPDLTTKNLWLALEPLLIDSSKIDDMKRAARELETPDAAEKIAERLIKLQ